MNEQLTPDGRQPALQDDDTALRLDSLNGSSSAHFSWPLAVLHFFCACNNHSNFPPHLQRRARDFQRRWNVGPRLADDLWLQYVCFSTLAMGWGSFL